VKLVNLGAGEISDRLTILALKITVGSERGSDVAHFEAERAALLQKIHSRTLNGAWFDAILELGAINALIWHAEDDLRAWRSPDHVYTMPDLEAIRILAFRLQALNDRRAGLVQQINKDAGDGDSKEKG
jgi:hypothetical protein